MPSYKGKCSLDRKEIVAMLIENNLIETTVRVRG